MPSLPIPGRDHDQWGHLLNEFLQVSHRDDGTIKDYSGAYYLEAFGGGSDKSSIDLLQEAKGKRYARL